MKLLTSLTEKDLHGKRVLVRLDLNVPVGESGTVVDADADRIRQALATLEYLKKAGAKTIVISHLGRDAKESLEPVVEYMNLHFTIGFIPHLSGDDVAPILDHMADGSAIMLENLRSDPREESNDPEFAKLLASYADIYVNDAFSVSHREHASIVGVPKLLPSYCGIQMEKEIEHLSKALHPTSPSLLVIAGAKFETKLPLIEKFLDTVDHIVIGGALANNFYRAMHYEIGKSLVDDSANIKSLVGHPKIIVPETVIVESSSGQKTKSARDVQPEEKIVDIAPESFENMAKIFEGLSFCIWNGPVGNYENGYTTGSESLVKKIAASRAYSVVGGGDTVALIEQLGLAKDFGFLSTGGGAMLDYLVQGTLPGIEALG